MTCPYEILIKVNHYARASGLVLDHG